jgi:hypothetical protein
MDNREFEKQWPNRGELDQRQRDHNALKKIIHQLHLAGAGSGKFEDYFVPTPPGLGDEQEGGG